MINFEHVIIHRVISLFFRVKFSQTVPNKRSHYITVFDIHVSGTFQEVI